MLSIIVYTSVILNHEWLNSHFICTCHEKLNLLKLVQQPSLDRALFSDHLKDHIFPVEGPIFQYPVQMYLNQPHLRDHIVKTYKIAFQDRFHCICIIY